jgi:hypothetical protein
VNAVSGKFQSRKPTFRTSAFNPTKFLHWLRNAETLNSFAAHAMSNHG